MQKRECPDFRSPEFGISAPYSTILFMEYKVLLQRHAFSITFLRLCKFIFLYYLYSKSCRGKSKVASYLVDVLIYICIYQHCTAEEHKYVNVFFFFRDHRFGKGIENLKQIYQNPLRLVFNKMLNQWLLVFTLQCAMFVRFYFYDGNQSSKF